VEQEDRRARAFVEEVHAQAILLDVVRAEVVAGEAFEAVVGGAVRLHRTTLRAWA
jgi:hypothetical protein